MVADNGSCILSFIYQEHDGLISVLANGKLPEPFLYIDARGAPPYWVEPIKGKRLGPFDSLAAAQAALILNLGEMK